MLHIGIDARLYGDKNTGLGVYLENLILNLQKIDKKNRYTLFVLKENARQISLTNKNFSITIVSPRWYTWREQLLLPFVYNRAELDLLHVPHYNVPFFYFKKTVVTIHDLTPLHFPPRSIITNAAFKLIFSRAIYFSHKIIAVSETIKKELLQRYRLSPRRVTVIYQGVRTFPRVTRQQSLATIKQFGITQPYLLYVGHWRVHKNILQLLRALKLFRHYFPEFSLVCAGIPHYQTKEITQLSNHLIKNKSLILTGFITPQELGALYKNCAGTILPSLSEGFGYPPLEGLIYKKIPFVSDIPLFHEILQEYACYFDPANHFAITQAILDGLQNEKIKNTIKENASVFLRRYDYKEMAKKTLDIYEEFTIKKI